MTAAVPEALRSEVIDALRNAGAQFAMLHGSRVMGTHRPDSDVAAWWAGDAPASFDVPITTGVDLVVLNGARSSWPDGSRWTGSSCSTTIHPPGCGGWPPPARSTRTSCLACSTAVASSRRPSAVVDETRVLRLLRSVTDDLAVLRREAAADAERRGDDLWLRGVKYTFVTAIEAWQLR